MIQPNSLPHNKVKSQFDFALRNASIISIKVPLSRNIKTNPENLHNSLNEESQLQSCNQIESDLTELSWLTNNVQQMFNKSSSLGLISTATSHYHHGVLPSKVTRPHSIKEKQDTNQKTKHNSIPSSSSKTNLSPLKKKTAHHYLQTHSF
jgi:hypothetical protein